MSRFKGAQKVPYVKVIHNLWPTGTKIAEWYEEMESQCLRCKTTDESIEHIFKCPSQHAATAFRQAIQTFRKALSKIKTAPIIITHLVGILRSHRVGYAAPMEPHVFLNPTIRNLTKKVYEKQLQLGPEALTKGLLVVEWESLQNYAVNQQNTCPTNVEWASRVIKALWEFSKHLWDERCTVINTSNKKTNRTLKTDELARVITKEINKLAKESKLFDTHQLISNIRRKLNKAPDHSMYKWLDMIRERKEAEKLHREQNQISGPRAQAITNYFPRLDNP